MNRKNKIVNLERGRDQRGSQNPINKGWHPPSLNWLKCNVATSWSARNNLAGGAWILRDQKGKTILHSRRAFGLVQDKSEAQFTCLMWAIESMKSHKIEKVVFSIQEDYLVKVITRPAAWPSFRYQSKELGLSLKSIKDWKFFVENSFSNRGALMIAKSITNDGRLQSYVASGHPAWLGDILAEDSWLASD